MDYKLQSMNRGTVLTITGDIMISHAGTLKETLLRAIDEKGDLLLDLTAVKAAGTSCIQLLCSFHKTLHSMNRELSLLGELSSSLRQTIRMAGFALVRACTPSRDVGCPFAGDVAHE